MHNKLTWPKRSEDYFVFNVPQKLSEVRDPLFIHYYYLINLDSLSVLNYGF